VEAEPIDGDYVGENYLWSSSYTESSCFIFALRSEGTVTPEAPSIRWRGLSPPLLLNSSLFHEGDFQSVSLKDNFAHGALVQSNDTSGEGEDNQKIAKCPGAMSNPDVFDGIRIARKPRCRYSTYFSISSCINDFRTRRLSLKKPPGHNLYGRHGRKRCIQCRKWKQKVLIHILAI
jgi:hypothetical protein